MSYEDFKPMIDLEGELKLLDVYCEVANKFNITVDEVKKRYDVDMFRIVRQVGDSGNDFNVSSFFGVREKSNPIEKTKKWRLRGGGNN